VGGKPIPVQFIQILPYVVTILVLAGFVGRSARPKLRARCSAGDSDLSILLHRVEQIPVWSLGGGSC